MAEPPKNDPRSIFSWCMYDWANSAYATTVVGGLLPAYFASVVVGQAGATLGGTTYSATALWAFATGAASLVVFLISPVLGAIADYSSSKKRFLLIFGYVGVLATLLLFSAGEGDVFFTLILFVIAQIGFIGANVFYDAFLPQLATGDEADWVSGKGYSFGYVGGGVQFALALLLVLEHERLGISLATATRMGIAMAALWWGGFTLFTAFGLAEPRTGRGLPGRYRNSHFGSRYVRAGFARVWQTSREASKFPHLVLFLAAFMLYNDGIQTVIQMATIYGTEELRLSTATLMVTLLIIQAIATVGAFLFSWLSRCIGSKRAVMVSLVGWIGVTFSAYFIQSAAQYFALGAGVGLILGGSQALSRSLFSSMIPETGSAEYFGFYTVFSKFSSIWGPFLFGFVRQLTGSARLSIVSVAAFFVVGMVLLSLVDVEKARLVRKQRD